MNNLFAMAEICMQQTRVAEKVAYTHAVWRLLQQGELSFASQSAPVPIARTLFPAQPVLLLPKQMPKRNLSSREGQAAFFHALAHIEFIAIYLAWDILYRFRGLPEQFYCDWLRIAEEEAQHFELLQQHLAQLGSYYGALPAHHGLWEHAEDTAHDILARLALVPRCMEARGLDVTPGMIARFATTGDHAGEAVLQRILQDEIGHVACGSYWFNFLCAEQGLEPVTHYQHLIGQYYKGGKPKGPFNQELRIMAGFSQAELDWLENETL